MSFHAQISSTSMSIWHYHQMMCLIAHPALSTTIAIQKVVLEKCCKVDHHLPPPAPPFFLMETNQPTRRSLGDYVNVFPIMLDKAMHRLFKRCTHYMQSSNAEQSNAPAVQKMHSLYADFQCWTKQCTGCSKDALIICRLPMLNKAMHRLFKRCTHYMQSSNAEQSNAPAVQKMHSLYADFQCWTKQCTGCSKDALIICSLPMLNKAMHRLFKRCTHYMQTSNAEQSNAPAVQKMHSLYADFQCWTKQCTGCSKDALIICSLPMLNKAMHRLFKRCTHYMQTSNAEQSNAPAVQKMHSLYADFQCWIKQCTGCSKDALIICRLPMLDKAMHRLFKRCTHYMQSSNAEQSNAQAVQKMHSLYADFQCWTKQCTGCSKDALIICSLPMLNKAMHRLFKRCTHYMQSSNAEQSNAPAVQKMHSLYAVFQCWTKQCTGCSKDALIICSLPMLNKAMHRLFKRCTHYMQSSNAEQSNAQAVQKMHSLYAVFQCWTKQCTGCSKDALIICRLPMLNKAMHRLFKRCTHYMQSSNAEQSNAPAVQKMHSLYAVFQCWTKQCTGCSKDALVICSLPMLNNAMHRLFKRCTHYMQTSNAEQSNAPAVQKMHSLYAVFQCWTKQCTGCSKDALIICRLPMLNKAMHRLFKRCTHYMQTSNAEQSNAQAVQKMHSLYADFQCWTKQCTGCSKDALIICRLPMLDKAMHRLFKRCTHYMQSSNAEQSNAPAVQKMHSLYADFQCWTKQCTGCSKDALIICSLPMLDKAMHRLFKRCTHYMQSSNAEQSNAPAVQKMHSLYADFQCWTKQCTGCSKDALIICSLPMLDKAMHRLFKRCTHYMQSSNAEQSNAPAVQKMHSLYADFQCWTKQCTDCSKDALIICSLPMLNKAMHRLFKRCTHYMQSSNAEQSNAQTVQKMHSLYAVFQCWTKQCTDCSKDALIICSLPMLNKAMHRLFKRCTHYMQSSNAEQSNAPAVQKMHSLYADFQCWTKQCTGCSKDALIICSLPMLNKAMHRLFKRCTHYMQSSNAEQSNAPTVQKMHPLYADFH